MNILEAKNEIKNTVKVYLDKEDGKYAIPVDRQRPVLLIGAPGIGKTAVMSAVAEELGIGFLGYTITHHTRQSAIGLPFISEKVYGGEKYSVTEYTMSEIIASVYDAIEKQGKKSGILFIDEINCVSETLAPAMLELLQHKRFGTHSIPDGWILTAAGNPNEYNKSASQLDMVVLDRVKKINVEPDYAAFKVYAAKNGISPAVTGFLSLNKDYLFKAERTLDGFRFVTPRGWEDLSFALREYEKFGIKVGAEFVGEYVQFPEIAAEFYRFYDVYSRYSGIFDDGKIQSGETESVDLSAAPFEDRFAVAEIIKAKAVAVAKRALDKGDPSASAKVGNLLSFAEKSLGGGQELTSAVMGMLENEKFVEFLTKFGCDKFYELNASLLIDDDISARAEKLLRKRAQP